MVGGFELTADLARLKFRIGKLPGSQREITAGTQTTHNKCSPKNKVRPVFSRPKNNCAENQRIHKYHCKYVTCDSCTVTRAIGQKK
ncbi:hypothetical protein ES708_09912 [subsurface metagenome]